MLVGKHMTTKSAYAELDQATIDDIVESVRASLRQHYGVAATPRFPFGIHHASARNKVREPGTRRYLKQSEISAFLAEWAIENGGAKAYAWQSVALATEEISAERRTKAAIEVLDEAERALRRFPPFLPWMKDRLTASRRPHR
jgi:hypothetical protein